MLVSDWLTSDELLPDWSREDFENASIEPLITDVPIVGNVSICFLEPPVIEDGFRIDALIIRI